MPWIRDGNIAKFLPGPGPAQTKKAGRGPVRPGPKLCYMQKMTNFDEF